MKWRAENVVDGFVIGGFVGYTFREDITAIVAALFIYIVMLQVAKKIDRDRGV